MIRVAALVPVIKVVEAVLVVEVRMVALIQGCPLSFWPVNIISPRGEARKDCQVGMTKPEMGASSGPGHNYLRSEHLCGLEGTVLLIKQIRLFRSRKENGDHYSHVKPLFGSMKA